MFFFNYITYLINFKIQTVNKKYSFLYILKIITKNKRTNFCILLNLLQLNKWQKNYHFNDWYI